MYTPVLLIRAAKELARPYGRWLYYRLFPERRPQYFLDCWQYRNANAADLGREPGAAPDFLFLPMTDWHARIQRSQQLCRALAGLGHRCFYVNPHLGLEYRRPFAADPWTSVRRLGERIFEIHIHLAREHPLESRLLTRRESERVVREISAVLRAAGTRTAAQVFSQPVWFDTALQLRRRLGAQAVYDCHDYLPGFERMPEEILRRENEAFRYADAVLFSSQWLAKRVQAGEPALAERRYLIRNGANVRDLQDPESRKVDEVRQRFPGKIAGYIGSVDHWFDVDAVEAAARTHPDCKFLIAGRVEDRKALRLKALANVVFVGEIPYADVGAYLAAFKAAMIPFVKTGLTLATNPIKLYEYFAAGLPVVAPALPEIAEHAELVYLADSPASFAEQFGRALEENDAAVRERRRAVAKQESWEARARMLLEVAAEAEAGPRCRRPGGSDR